MTIREASEALRRQQLSSVELTATSGRRPAAAFRPTEESIREASEALRRQQLSSVEQITMPGIQPAAAFRPGEELP